jgi:CubicO group peptidase (beta-lactamase class C family)
MTVAESRIETTELDHVARREMERWAVPGLAIGIWRDGDLETHSYGVSSLETRTPVTAGTIFQVGSISKVFTATLIMQLVDQGRLDLDTPVRRYLPSLRLADEEAAESVTLWHLLTHTAGFYGDRFDDFGCGDDALTRSLATFHTLRQYTPPGALFAYCNTGFQVAGAVIEAVLCTTFENAMRERIIGPLGLTRTFYFAHEAITYPVAVGHNAVPPSGDALPDTPVVAREWGRSRCRAAQGGVLSTVEDLLRFAAFHMGDGTVNATRLLSEASLQAMQQPLVEATMSPHWGIGWAVEPIDGVTTVGHGGTTNGFQAQLTLVPERRFAIACLTNSNLGAAAIRPIVAWLLERGTGLHRREPVPVTVSAGALAHLAGRYERPGIVTTVTAGVEGLQVQVRGKNPITGEDMNLPVRSAVPIGSHRFRVLDGETAGSSFDFIDDEGSPRFLRLGGRLSERVSGS